MALPEDNKNIHSIWVQGDYADNEELQTGIASRKGSKATGWQNLLWVYQSAQENPEFDEVSKLAFHTVSIDDFGIRM